MKQLSDFKIIDSFLTPYNISYLPFCDREVTDSFLSNNALPNNPKKIVPNHQKNLKNIFGSKKLNGPITSTFGTIIDLTNSS